MNPEQWRTEVMSVIGPYGTEISYDPRHVCPYLDIHIHGGWRLRIREGAWMHPEKIREQLSSMADPNDSLSLARKSEGRWRQRWGSVPTREPSCRRLLRSWAPSTRKTSTLSPSLNAEAARTLARQLEREIRARHHARDSPPASRPESPPP